MGALAHEAENLLDAARKDKIVLGGAHIDVTFEVVDALKQLVTRLTEALSTGCLFLPIDNWAAVVERVKAVLAAKAGPEAAKEIPPAAQAKLGDILVQAGAASQETINRALQIQKESLAPPKIGEVLLENSLASRKLVDAALDAQAYKPSRGETGQILVEMGAVTRQNLATALTLQQQKAVPPKLGEVLVREGGVAAVDVAHALRSQQTGAETAPAAAARKAIMVREAVKVDADRLDRLIDTIGELVIAESMARGMCLSLIDSAAVHASSSDTAARTRLTRQIGQLDKITRELQEMGTSLRMVPIRATFQKMARLVRDLSKKANKTVEFVTVGDDTELDRNVVDKIGDPLVHMVRNAVDHGIEKSPEDRVKAGKPATATVCLRAFHKGGSIFIEIEDDGRGLNREAIIAKARERGIISEGQSLSDREIWGLIFEPGFSTAKEITDVSGRGVGMDVVKRSIDSLRGQVEIATQPGKGSVFTIRLPLTLAIIDGMVIRVGKERFIIPTLSMVMSVRPDEKNVSSVVGKSEMLQLQGELLPLFRLGKLLNSEGACERVTEGIVVVVESDGRKTGLLIDEILGQQQIVIKSLGEAMQGIDGIAGAAIMPDGRVGLILDVGGLVRLTHDT